MQMNQPTIIPFGSRMEARRPECGSEYQKGARGRKRSGGIVEAKTGMSEKEKPCSRMYGSSWTGEGGSSFPAENPPS